MWSSICGWFDQMEENRPARERLKDEFIESQITGDRARIEEIREEWKKLDEKEDFYLKWY